MRKLWIWAFMALATLFVTGCDTGDTTDNANVGNDPVYCTGNKADDPNCIPNPEWGEDAWSESDDPDPSSEDILSEECVPTIPEGAEVTCEGKTGTFFVEWDWETCTATLWCYYLGKRDEIASKIPPELLISGNEYHDFYCTVVQE